MTREFTPYPELEKDIDHLVASTEGRCPAYCSPRRRLLAAFKEPECGAWVANWIGDALFLHPGPGTSCRLVCRQPRGHDGPHIPDLPAECWRMPDA